jgi:hypothetical protein
VRELSEADLAALAEAAGTDLSPAALRADPARTEALLRSPVVHRALFGGSELDPHLFASPLLVFSVLVHRVAAELEDASFIDEWLGPGRTVPVFDVAALRGFLADAGRRAFLAELLASYTRSVSGSVWHRTARGWRRRRYSDLDPMAMAQLLEVVPEDQRRAVCRRLGDLALFLSGVFPEYAASHPLEPRQLDGIRRLLDATGLDAPAPAPEELGMAGGPQRGIWLLEWLGRRAYRLAARRTAADRELREVADAFGRARRVLNVLTGRHLYPRRERWFPSAEG